MFDEKFYSNTVIYAEESIQRAERAINASASNISKRGHGVVQAFCKSALEWRKLGVHVEIMGFSTNESEMCSCGLRLHGKSIDTAIGHLNAQLQPTNLFIRNFNIYFYEVVCQECGGRTQVRSLENYRCSQISCGSVKQ